MDKYVGVCGLMTRAQAAQVLHYVPSLLPINPITDSHICPKLMVGALVSYKTLCGAANKYPNKFPPINTLGSIPIDDERIINCVHYNTDKAEDKADSLLHQLSRVVNMAGELLDAIQLNVALPDPAQLEEFKKLNRSISIVLQVSPNLPQYRGWTIDRIVTEMVRAYDHVAAKFLIDYSRGLGQALDPQRVRDFIDAFAAHGVKCNRLTIAGGFRPENIVRLAGDIVARHPLISLDAENGLRTHAHMSGGYINMPAVCKYIQRAFSLYPGLVSPQTDED